MPTSVLLAVLAAAALLALAPALVRRYDTTERLLADRVESIARVVVRCGASSGRRRRTVPGPRPINPPTWFVLPSDLEPARSGNARPPGTGVRRRPQPLAVYRRRRVLTALGLLNLAEVGGVAFVGPGFWIGFAVSASLMLVYLIHLRFNAVRSRRERVRQARRLAAVQRQQAARMASRREALRRAAAARAVAHRDAQRLSQRYVDRSTDNRGRSVPVRGRPHQSGGHRAASF